MADKNVSRDKLLNVLSEVYISIHSAIKWDRRVEAHINENIVPKLVMKRLVRLDNFVRSLGGITSP